MPFSAKGLLNDAKLTLEKEATDKFGAAVDDFARGALEQLKPNNTSETSKAGSRNDGSWYATSYAAALAGGSGYRPKMKFMFKVEFFFSEAAKNAFPEVFMDSQRNGFTFMIKQVERPKIDFEYDEEVNMYNFRTSVLKKIKHRPLTMIFMDDVGNKVFDFVRALMAVHQPISQGGARRDNSLDKPRPANEVLPHGSGMAFSAPNSSASSSDIAHRRVLNPARPASIAYGNSIESIRVKQIFVDSSEVDLGKQSKMTAFDFISPRIISFDFDELSHEANDVSMLTLVFDYDWMEMVKIGSLGTGQNEYVKAYDIPVPGVGGAPSDITPNVVGKVGAPSPSSGGGNRITHALAGIVGRGASSIVSDKIGSLVNAAGGGRFATAIGSVASAGLSGPIGGYVSGAARDLLSSGGGSSPNRIRSVREPRILSDAATAGPDTPISAVSSADQIPNSRGDF